VKAQSGKLLELHPWPLAREVQHQHSLSWPAGKYRLPSWPHESTHLPRRGVTCVSALERLEIGDDVGDLTRIELEFRHRRVTGDDSFRQRLLEFSTG